MRHVIRVTGPDADGFYRATCGPIELHRRDRWRCRAAALEAVARTYPRCERIDVSDETAEAVEELRAERKGVQCYAGDCGGWEG